jgi:large subunit ribosomal protein L6
MVISMLEYEVPVEEGVKVSIEGDTMHVSGPKGELHRVFSHPHIKIKVKDGKITLSSELGRRKVKALMGTWKAHLKNMMTGVGKGFECSMKLVYAHFPVKLEQEGNKLAIKNFLGSRSARFAEILDGVEIKIEGDTVKVLGIDREKVGQTAANIEHATKVQGYDRRVFQDGIYVTHKPVPVSEGEGSKGE